MKNTEKTMDKIVALCKNRGIIFAGSEIYGGRLAADAQGLPGVQQHHRGPAGGAGPTEGGPSGRRRGG